MASHGGRQKIKNIKFIIGFSIAGFLLSFFFGLFSGSKFGIILFKALIFCLIFGAIGVGIDFLYTNFLDVPGSDAAPDAPASADGAAGQVGQTVDITIQDEDLPAAENAPGFFVGANRQMLNPEDSSDTTAAVEETRENIARTEEYTPVIKTEDAAPVSSAGGAAISPAQASDSAVTAAASHSEKEAAIKNDAAQGFVPISLAENVPDIAEVSDVSADSAKKSVNEVNTEPPPASETEELGILPDFDNMENFMPDVSEDNSSVGEEVSGGNYVPVAQKRKSAPAGETDAETMAKAISTLLTKEKN